MIVRATHLKDFQFELQSGGHLLVSDQSAEYGGDGTGPMPTELLLWAVAACFAQTVCFVASRMRKTVAGLVLEVGGVKDTQKQRFASISIGVSAACPTETLIEIVRKAKKYCYVTNSLSPQVHLAIDVRCEDGLGEPCGCTSWPV
jgi:putative redox protein